MSREMPPKAQHILLQSLPAPADIALPSDAGTEFAGGTDLLFGASDLADLLKGGILLRIGLIQGFL